MKPFLHNGTDNTILVLGSSNTDMTIKVARIPKAGETILGGKFASNPGGKGANQAVSAARAGGHVTFIGRVGHDMFGEKALATLASEGINVDHVVSDQATPSGIALIFVGESGQNSIAVASGANGKLAVADVERAASAFARNKILLVQLETPLPAVAAAIRIATARKMRVVLNPAPACPLPRALLAKVDVITPNEAETELLTGIPITDEASAALAAEKFLAMGVRHAIITMGSKGAFIASKDVRRFIPSHKVKAVDATAAGDVFNGALAVALGEGKTILAAAYFANAAAAISVSRHGAQESAPNRREIMHLLEKYSPRQRNDRVAVRQNGVIQLRRMNGEV